MTNKEIDAMRSPNEQVLETHGETSGKRILASRKYDWSQTDFDEAILDWFGGNAGRMNDILLRRKKATEEVEAELRRDAEYRDKLKRENRT